MTADKPARNRRSAEQMLVELEQRVREISDLNAASDLLNWDQATYMPERGADARGRQRWLALGGNSICLGASQTRRHRALADRQDGRAGGRG
jgi:hypothetical protein